MKINYCNIILHLGREPVFVVVQYFLTQSECRTTQHHSRGHQTKSAHWNSVVPSQMGGMFIKCVLNTDAVFNRCLCFLPKKEEEAILHTAAVCHVGHECFELTYEIRIRHSVKLTLKGKTPTQENYRWFTMATTHVWLDSFPLETWPKSDGKARLVSWQKCQQCKEILSFIFHVALSVLHKTWKVAEEAKKSDWIVGNDYYLLMLHAN